MKKIVCLGGGPAGLYSAILLKKALPACEIDVYERNRPDDTFGWGVVFSDNTMGNFREADEPTHAAIQEDFHHWDDIAVHYRGQEMISGGHGFCGIARKRLLAILQQRAAELGVRQHFEHSFEDEEAFADADLVIAADGVNSQVRTRHADVFKPDIDVRRCRYIWLGTTQKFAAFTFAFEQTAHGWFQIHAYQFSRELSTVIVETREETWAAHGLDRASAEESIAFCERLFAAYLGGHRLQSNAKHLRGSAWLKFPRILCERWHHGRTVLIGDAAHTAHFSIGSGTKLAMEDAIALTRHIINEPDVEKALWAYREERQVEVLKLQSAARNRMEWFENVARYARLEPQQFAYSLLTGSQRIGHENLKARDPGFVREYEKWLGATAGLGNEARPPMFLPFRLRDLTLQNRVVVAPMLQYMAQDGLPGDWHLVHYGSRALGGAGLILSEMAAVSPEARVTPGCAGIWNEAQRDAWQRIVAFVHATSQARIGLQLGHAGRKGSTQVGWEAMFHPLPRGNWPLLAPSPLPYIEGKSQVPAEMSRRDMDTVLAQFVRAAGYAAAAGFDLLELQLGHGYLLGTFISPLTNVRKDEYGGALAGRLRFPLEVIDAVAAVWPADRPLGVRISASDWAPGGLDEAELLVLARVLKERNVDFIDVSSAETVSGDKPRYGRMWQTPFADLIRNEVDIPVIAVGNIFEADHVNSIVAAGRADLCAIGRPHLATPAWTIEAAAFQGYGEQWWPLPYQSAKSQLEKTQARVAETPP